jgi:hypothetical protein
MTLDWKMAHKNTPMPDRLILAEFGLPSLIRHVGKYATLVKTSRGLVDNCTGDRVFIMSEIVSWTYLD